MCVDGSCSELGMLVGLVDALVCLAVLLNLPNELISVGRNLILT